MVQKEYQCEVCGATLDTEAGLEAHRREMHPQYSCDICGETFDSQSEQEAHYRIAHPDDTSTP